MKKQKLLIIICSLTLFTIGISCTEEEDPAVILITMKMDSEVAYTKIDSLVYRNTNGSFQKTLGLNDFWELRVESDIRDSIGFTVYGEAANLNSQQILNGITLSIKGVHEVDGVERNVNESKRLEPLFDTLKLYHSIFYKP